MRVADLRACRVAVITTCREGAADPLRGRGSAAVEGVGVVVLHVVVTQAGGDAELLYRADFAVQVGRNAAIDHIVLVDLDRRRAAERVGLAAEGVDGLVEANRVLVARAGAEVVVQADDETGLERREVAAILAQEAKRLAFRKIAAGIVTD
ncbi:hypothetical protein SDC9_187626 [bioreactor metagenome]|uniref:Uncharacterized protein n=1 Tax=bioreactor metagenome TaxID=1076179 RepID=A0A645HM27_9ZZZZ